MYAYLKGKFSFKSASQVYVDVHGVGYEVNITLNTYTAIEGLDDGMLYTYLQIKEDAHTLYGFFDKEEKDMFVLLISVSGVGAATARMMLSSLRPDEVTNAITSNNVKLIESVKGIGKKTAERLVLELRDKVGNKSTTSSQTWEKGVFSIEKDAVNALVALGIAPKQAEAAVKKIITAEPTITKLEHLIKQALKAI
ncbi:Holliday junction branch migration protein RuvA [Ferruginibacter yonginensis]|uniref:Holliday junction branch migration complex subunit RuvA n=1 Tax=Ferruginibacter yonginensis TaxID=1310416 RepID=A0ABV8QPP1_9BACT